MNRRTLLSLAAAAAASLSFPTVAKPLPQVAQKPPAAGLSVPGMPVGSPGMEVGSRKDAFQVLLIDKAGRSSVFATYPKT